MKVPTWNSRDRHTLPSRAAAGTLVEVFSFGVTMAEYACGAYGRADRLGGAMVYEVREPGIVVRCPSCDNALIRLAHNRGRYLVDLRGRDTLQSDSLSSRFNHRQRTRDDFW